MGCDRFRGLDSPEAEYRPSESFLSRQPAPAPETTSDHRGVSREV